MLGDGMRERNGRSLDGIAPSSQEPRTDLPADVSSGAHQEP